MISKTQIVSLLILGLLSFLNSPTCLASADSNLLENGIYLVARQSTNKKEIEPISNKEVLLKNDYRYLEDSEKQKPVYLALKKSPFIPLSLDKNPQISKDERGHAKLQLTLSKDQIKPLNKFTKENCGKTVAIVIGSDTVSIHKIREPITGGAIQITRCTDNGCKALYIKLSNKQSQK